METKALQEINYMCKKAINELRYQKKLFSNLKRNNLVGCYERINIIKKNSNFLITFNEQNQ